MLGAVGPLIVLSGPTGVGKSTVGSLVAAEFSRSVHLRADDLMASVVGGFVDPNLAEAEPQRAVSEKIVACRAGGLSCAVTLEARQRMVVREPIEPISGHFASASNMGQSATGCLTVSSFLRSFRHVRRERRRRR